jgi:hypothetical protein
MDDPWEYWWEISSDEEIEWAPPIIFETSLEDLVKPQRKSRRRKGAFRLAHGCVVCSVLIRLDIGGIGSLRVILSQEDDSWDDFSDLMSLGSMSDEGCCFPDEDDWEAL